MIDLVAAFVLFGLFVSTHIIAYRLKLIAFQPPALLFLGVLWLVAYFVMLKTLPDWYPTEQRTGGSVGGGPLVLTSIILYGLLCLWYLVQCTFAQFGSPSMDIFKAINRHPKRKASFDELKSEFSNDKIILARLDDLVTGGYVRFDGIRYHLLGKGELIAKMIGGYRRLIQRGEGG